MRLRKKATSRGTLTQIINQFVLPAAQAFEKKYGIHVDYVRADAE